MTKHRWRGELAKPIRPRVIRPRGLRVTADTAAKANKEMDDLYQQAIEQACLEKLTLLMDHYGIPDKTDFGRLALALAIDHDIPGFRIASVEVEYDDQDGPRFVVYGNKRGRPSKWSPAKLDALLAAVAETKKKHGLSTDRAGLKVIATQNPRWSRPANYRGDLTQWIRTLQNQLAAAKRADRAASVHGRATRLTKK